MWQPDSLSKSSLILWTTSQVGIITSTDRWANWYSERLNDLSKVTWVGSSTARMKTEVCPLRLASQGAGGLPLLGCLLPTHSSCVKRRRCPPIIRGRLKDRRKWKSGRNSGKDWGTLGTAWRGREETTVKDTPGRQAEQERHCSGGPGLLLAPVA